MVAAAARGPATEEIVTDGIDGGILYPPSDVEALAEVLRRLADDSTGCRDMDQASPAGRGQSTVRPRHHRPGEDGHLPGPASFSRPGRVAGPGAGPVGRPTG